MGYLYQGFLHNSYKVPSFMLDVTIFYLLKRMFYPNYYSEFSVPMMANVEIGGTAALIRHFLFYPVQSAWKSIPETYELGFKDFFNQVKSNLQNNYRLNGWKGLYKGSAKLIPGLFIAKGIQIGGTESTLMRTKHSKGHTGFFRKFILCFGAVITARYISHPFQMVSERLEGTEKNIWLGMKRYWGCLISLAKSEGIGIFTKARSSAFSGSMSALAFTMLYHTRDDVVGYRH